MDEIKKATDRLAVLEKIRQYEKEGRFDEDVEDDPQWEPLDLQKIDFLRKRLSSKIKTFIGNRIAIAYFNRLFRKKVIIFAGVEGLENLEGLKGGAMVTCNHCHMFDHYAAYLSFNKYFKKGLKSFRIWKIVREGNYEYPGMIGFFMRNCNTIPINGRGNNSFALAGKCFKTVKYFLEKGKKILIFPEQGMWWNYRKPRPLKKGAFLFAAKLGYPLIPCFLTMKDSDIIGADGFNVQEFTFHILPVIYPDKNLSVEENCIRMRNKNYELWKELYEKTYGLTLNYSGTDGTKFMD